MSISRVPALLGSSMGSPRRIPRAAIVLALALVVSPAGVRGQEVLTNESVIAMKQARLPDTVILAKIRSTQNKFDLSTNALIALKGAGVSDQIIEAMVTQPAPTPTAQPAPPPPQVAHSPTVIVPGIPAPGAPGIVAAPVRSNVREVIYHVAGAKNVEMTPVAVAVETNASFWKRKNEIVLQGRRARYRIPDRQPVFLSPYSSTEVLLVRLKPGDDHDDRNLTVGKYEPFRQQSGVSASDRVEVVTETDPGGLYKISPARPLRPGEYGFLVLGMHVTTTTGKIFEFGVD